MKRRSEGKADGRKTDNSFSGEDSNDIVKPVTPEVLREKINRILETKKRGKGAEGPSPTPPAPDLKFHAG